MSSKKKGLLSLLAIAAVMLVLMLASGGIYNGLASIGRHNVVPAGNSFTAGTYEGTGQGKMGDIRVKVTLSDTAIESIEVLDQTETPDIADPAFASLPAAMVDHQTVYDVDDVAGATVTSHAIKEAVAGALAQAGVDARTLVPVEGGAAAASSETEAAAAETEAEKPAAETEAETEAAAAADSESLYADGVYEGTGNGNGGEVKVNVTVENGKISDIVLQEGHSETPGIYEMAVDQVIPAIIEAQSTDVDSASGASMTSAGIREAVEDALSKAAAGSADAAEESGSGYADGVYEGSGTGNGGEMKVSVTVEGGKISDIVLQEGHSETPGIYEMAVDQVIPAIIEAQSTDVDSASGASMTSAGIREAVEDALSKAAAAAPAEEGNVVGEGQTLTITAQPGSTIIVNNYGEAVTEAAEAETEAVTEAAEAETEAVTEAQEAETEAVTEAAEAGLTAAAAPAEEAGAYADGVYEGTGSGNGGDMNVEVTVENGKTTDSVLKDDHNETPGIFEMAVDQVIPAIIEAQSTEVDSASGASMSSAGIKEAVEDALSKAGGAEAVEETGTEAAETEAVEVETEAAETEAAETEAAEVETEAVETEAEAAEPEEAGESAYADGVYEGTGSGNGGDMNVEVTVENGKITDIVLKDDHNETPGIFEMAVDQVIPAIIEAQSTEVDSASGASMSSAGIKEAVEDALSKAGGAETAEESETEAAETEAEKAETEEEAAETEAEKAETEADAENKAGYKDGVYEGTGTGNGGDMTVTVTVKGGKITDIVLEDGHAETPGIFDLAVEQVIPAIIEAQSTDVDSATGASMSSEGIKEAVEDALSKAV